MSLQILVRVAEIKVISFGGGVGGKRNGSGEWDGKNLVRMARKDATIWIVFEGSLDQC